jgi:cold shock CspA family protein
MARGTIIHIDRDHGEGTIRPDDGTRDLGFYHASVVGRLFDRLDEGQHVEFDRRSYPISPGRFRAQHPAAAGSTAS